MARGGQKSKGDPVDWVTRAADDAVRHAGEGNLVTVASGASPSGPIHLGNLREFITPHFVAEELRRRGVPVRHLHSWDNFDRFRKVPAGVPASWSEHIGRPLTAVPDPWECHSSWADHFKAPLQESLRELGVEMEEVSQTEMYTSGAYREQVLLAVSRRDDIEAVLARHRTKKVAPAEDASEQEAADLADSVANEDDDAPADGDAIARFPYRPYCRQCGRDTVTTTAYDEATTTLSYTCSSCGFEGTTNLLHRHRRQARLEGRLADAVGLRVGELRAGRPRPHDAGIVLHGRHRDRLVDLRLARAGACDLRLRRLRRRAEDVVVGRRRADRDRRAADPRVADAALALRPPRAHAGLRHRLRSVRRAAVRRVGRAGSQGRRPGEVRRRDPGLAPRRRDRGRSPALARGAPSPSGCCPPSPT